LSPLPSTSKPPIIGSQMTVLSIGKSANMP
jgi:hypothetical protein